MKNSNNQPRKLPKEELQIGNVIGDLVTGAGLTSRQILLSLFDLNYLLKYRTGLLHPGFRREVPEYWQWRRADRQKFRVALKRLAGRGLIRIYHKHKNPVLVLTRQGREAAADAALASLSTTTPDNWDHKWRLVIFDIPEKHRLARDVFRRRIKEMGFYQIQKSVFVYPFDTTPLVMGLRYRFLLGPKEVQYIVADRIEAEDLLIEHFLDKEILRRSHFRK